MLGNKLLEQPVPVMHAGLTRCSGNLPGQTDHIPRSKESLEKAHRATLETVLLSRIKIGDSRHGETIEGTAHKYSGTINRTKWHRVDRKAHGTTSTNATRRRARQAPGLPAVHHPPEGPPQRRRRDPHAANRSALHAGRPRDRNRRRHPPGARRPGRLPGRGRAPHRHRQAPAGTQGAPPPTPGNKVVPTAPVQEPHARALMGRAHHRKHRLEPEAPAEPARPAVRRRRRLPKASGKTRPASTSTMRRATPTGNENRTLFPTAMDIAYDEEPQHGQAALQQQRHEPTARATGPQSRSRPNTAGMKKTGEPIGPRTQSHTPGRQPSRYA